MPSVCTGTLLVTKDRKEWLALLPPQHHEPVSQLFHEEFGLLEEIGSKDMQLSGYKVPIGVNV